MEIQLQKFLFCIRTHTLCMLKASGTTVLNSYEFQGWNSNGSMSSTFFPDSNSQTNSLNSAILKRTHVYRLVPGNSWGVREMKKNTNYEVRTHEFVVRTSLSVQNPSIMSKSSKQRQSLADPREFRAAKPRKKIGLMYSRWRASRNSARINSTAFASGGNGLVQKALY